jgi:amino acid adenylation domain-containing protein
MQRPQRSYTCIHRRFEAQALATPDAIAIAASEMQISYDELNRRANQLAHSLQQRGVRPDVLVGICAERSPALVIGLLGILKAGGAYVALDPLFPRERLAFMLADTQVHLLLTQERLRAGLPASQATIICLDADWPALSRADEQNPTSAVTSEHLAYITYTSGSTGLPKGSAIPHRSIIGFMDGVDYLRMDGAQTYLHYSSISWDALTLELWPALVYGARCVLYPALLPTPYDLGESIRAQRISLLWLTVALFNAIIDSIPECLAGVPQLLIGGEVVSIAHVRRALECLPATQLVNGYGPSECTVVACCYVIPRVLPDTLEAIPIGRPIGDRAVYLLDGHFNRTPIGVPGELFIGGPSVARCYHNRPALTAERFVPNPFIPPAAPPPGGGGGPGGGALPNGRSGALSLGRHHRVRRADRPSGEDSRLSDRAGGDRDGAGAASRRE